MLNDTALKIYNEASAATVAGNRTRLARAIKKARRYHQAHGEIHHGRFGRLSLVDAIMYHCNYVGWPVRLRPNWRYI